jgi:hypothetical protein
MTEPFRFQYIFGRQSNRLPKFKSLSFPDERQLLVQQALPVAVIREGAAIGLMLGHVFDSRSPTATAQGILNSLVHLGTDDALSWSGRLAGRWTAILINKDREIAFGDACGTLQLNYLTQNGETWVASSSRLMGHCIEGLRPSQLTFGEFPQMQAHKEQHDGLPFPHFMTEFDDVRVCLPNHYLDLKAGITRRYHPTSKYAGLEARDVVPKIAGLLENIVRAISLRSKIAVAVSAGFDSRVIVGAVSRVPDLAAKSLFFSFQDPFQFKPGHYDIVNGAKLARIVGGTHSEIKVEHTSDSVRNLCRSSEAMIAPCFENWAGRCLEAPFQDRIVVTGWCSEVARCYIRWPGSDDLDTETASDFINAIKIHAPAHIAVGMPDPAKVPYMMSGYGQWFNDAKAVRARTALNILDLFYWELRMGRWCSSGLSVLNSASDWIAVYSCRELLEAMLSVKEEQRDGEPILYRSIIECLNPDLMQVPFNRHRWEFRRDTRSSLVRLSKGLGVYDAVRRFKRKVLARGVSGVDSGPH